MCDLPTSRGQHLLVIISVIKTWTWRDSGHYNILLHRNWTVNPGSLQVLAFKTCHLSFFRFPSAQWFAAVSFTQTGSLTGLPVCEKVRNRIVCNEHVMTRIRSPWCEKQMISPGLSLKHYMEYNYSHQLFLRTHKCWWCKKLRIMVRVYWMWT